MQARIKKKHQVRKHKLRSKSSIIHKTEKQLQDMQFETNTRTVKKAITHITRRYTKQGRIYELELRGILSFQPLNPGPCNRKRGQRNT